MRVLFTTQPSLGHLHPLVPIARECVAAGHEVVVAASPAFCPAVVAAGLRALPAGLDWLEEDLAATFPRFAAMPPGPERVAWFWSHIFTEGTAGTMADALLALARDWRPDVVVRETAEHGGLLAAEVLGVPHAVVQVVAYRPQTDAWVAEPLARQRARLGLPPDPDLATPRRYLHLSPFPRALQDPAVPLPPTHHDLRPVVFDRPSGEDLPAWASGALTPPVVYASLGTVHNRAVAGLQETLLAGLRDVAGTLILTVGRTVDPADLGPQPVHVHVERYLPQSLIFPQCDLVVTHGGAGTLVAAVVEGLPLVVIPLGADQPANAARVAAAGLGLVVGPEARTPGAIGAAARAVLAGPAYGERTQRLRDELAALPGPEYAVALLERLARERRPIATGNERA